ncbi:Allophanate hydrolase subunit 1 [Rhodococcus sp. RD6.2]|uniref:5-oxoprolinase subunit B family protein n=1 Tax=Rhodococcus sp. RD6.2 TaxID=260936 RepID=UPI00063B2F6D|nr:allophanate hydrolase subunit 1 [Rhodococcus sp. RD6.2]CRK50254.1 Allophanate hydrolase subunit 1 [Rhodococcus sp. RD6.2]
MRVLDVGDGAVLVEFGTLDAVLAAFRALDSSRPDGIDDIVPAARTILVRFDRRVTNRESVRAWLRDIRPVDTAEGVRADAIDIGVHYDGPDLEEVGDLTGLGVAGVIAAHTGADWTVAFAGFAPGFGYLVGGPESLHVPRRSSPRTSVPSGSVGLAGGFSGIYPRSSPGGWQLIGSTDVSLWDTDRDPPALLRPGVGVRFRAV